MRLPFLLDRSFVALLFFYIGRICYSEGYYQKVVGQLSSLWLLVITVVSLVICVFATHPGHPIPADGDYGNPIVFTLVALVGIAMTLAASSLFSRGSHITGFFTTIVQETMAILIGQFLAFYFVDCIRCGTLSPMWLFLMLVAGVGLPLSVSRTWKRIR